MRKELISIGRNFDWVQLFDGESGFIRFKAPVLSAFHAIVHDPLPVWTHIGKSKARNAWFFVTGLPGCRSRPTPKNSILAPRRQEAEFGERHLIFEESVLYLDVFAPLRESQSVFVVFVTANLDKSDVWLRRRREFAYKSKGHVRSVGSLCRGGT